MIGHMRHGSPPRLLALQSIFSPNRRESLPTPSAGDRMTPASIRFISPFSVPFRLGLDYWAASEMANKQAQRARGGRRQEWRLIAPAKGPRLATAFQETRVLKSPKSRAKRKTR